MTTRPALYVPDTEHSSLGASNAERWMVCAGSVAAEAGQPNNDTVYTAEGTAAHRIAELAYEYQRDPELWEGQLIRIHSSGDVPHFDIEVDREMVDSVRIFARIVNTLRQTAKLMWIERKFDLRFPDDLPRAFGTADVCAVEAEPGYLDVPDLKYGKGVKKNAKDNPQLMIYGLGAWLELMIEKPKMAARIQYVRLWIVQPRILDENEPHISTHVVSVDELKAFGRKLLIAAKKTQEKNAPRVAGEHCRFCKAKSTCTTFRGVALQTAKLEFKEVLEGKQPPLPTSFTPEELAQTLEALPMLEEWVKGVRQLAHHEVVVARRTLPGYAMKPKGSHRKWGDPQMVTSWATKNKIDERHLFEKPKMISPAQLEKHLQSLARIIAFPADLVAEKEVIEYVLCREDDPKAIRRGKSDFTALEPAKGRKK